MKIIIDEPTIVSVLSNYSEIEKRLQERKHSIYQIYYSNNSIEHDITSSRMIHESSPYPFNQSTAIFSYCHTEIESSKQQMLLEKELLNIADQFEMMHRVLICYESLPFRWKEILTKLYIQHQKWGTLAMSSSQISKFRRCALKQILDWYYSELTELEIQLNGNKKALESLKKGKGDNSKK